MEDLCRPCAKKRAHQRPPPAQIPAPAPPDDRMRATATAAAFVALALAAPALAVFDWAEMSNQGSKQQGDATFYGQDPDQARAAGGAGAQGCLPPKSAAATRRRHGGGGDGARRDLPPFLTPILPPFSLLPACRTPRWAG